MRWWKRSESNWREQWGRGLVVGGCSSGGLLIKGSGRGCSVMPQQFRKSWGLSQTDLTSPTSRDHVDSQLLVSITSPPPFPLPPVLSRLCIILTPTPRSDERYRTESIREAVVTAKFEWNRPTARTTTTTTNTPTTTYHSFRVHSSTKFSHSDESFFRVLNICHQDLPIAIALFW